MMVSPVVSADASLRAPCWTLRQGRGSTPSLRALLFWRAPAAPERPLGLLPAQIAIRRLSGPAPCALLRLRSWRAARVLPSGPAIRGGISQKVGRTFQQLRFPVQPNLDCL